MNQKQLKDLMKQYPTCEIMIQVREDTLNYDYDNTCILEFKCEVKELALYGEEDERWVDREDLEDYINDDIKIDYLHTNLTDEEFEEIFNERFSRYKFKRFIIIKC